LAFFLRIALDRLDRYEMDGREISIVVAKDKRKSPGEMKTVDRPRESRDHSRERRDGDRGTDREKVEKRSASPEAR
jgi:hypothetical protein